MSEVALEFFTIKEVAELLKLSERSIRRLISDDRLAAYRCGRQIRISQNDLNTYLASVRNAVRY